MQQTLCMYVAHVVHQCCTIGAENLHKPCGMPAQQQAIVLASEKKMQSALIVGGIKSLPAMCVSDIPVFFSISLHSS